MTRREFRLISGQGAGPSVEDITRRKPTRRHFKTLQAGSGTPRNRVKAVTIKGIDKTDGTTIWEYGPGSFWRHHYGADAISGVVPNLSATLNKYAISAGAYPTYNNTGNRNTATLAANVAEAMTVTKLDSLDGTVIESAVMPGMFCNEVGTTFVSLAPGLSINNAAALSGGDYVVVGERLPFIEFVDYASNTANKEYILHPHGMIGGNVYIKTRTSSEVITIPYNSDAAAVEALFEATSDCVSATATGGPWPLSAIEIEVEWSASGGDISGIAMTATQSADTGGTSWTQSTGTVTEGIDFLIIDVTTVSVGSTFTFSLIGGPDFSYAAETTDVSDFLVQLKAAMEAFALDQADTGWMAIAVGIPDSIQVSSNTLTIYYSTELGFDPVTVELTAGGEPIVDSRNVRAAAIVYSTSTGLMTSSVGYRFGFSEASPPAKMFEESSSLPTVTGLNVLGIQSIGSGPGNTVIVTPDIRNSGDLNKARVVETWEIASGTWSQVWQLYCNAQMLMPPIIACESGYVLCPIAAKRFDGTDDRTAAKLAVADGTITEVMTTYGSINSPDNIQSTQMFDDTPTKYLTWGFEVTYEDSAPGSNSYTINDRGIDTWADGDDFRLGAFAFAADASAIYALRARHVSGSWRYDSIGDNTDDELFFKFLATYTARSAEPQQFRFKLDRMPGTNYTSWLDWYATDTEMETALNALLGSGNVTFIDFGLDPTPVVNNPVALIEFNPMFRFYTDRGYTPGSGRIPSEYFEFSGGAVVGGVKIEMQTITPFTDPDGMAAYDITDATLIWSRAFGTIGAATITVPQHAWVQGDFVYAYGIMVDSEF